MPRVDLRCFVSLMLTSSPSGNGRPLRTYWSIYHLHATFATYFLLLRIPSAMGSCAGQGGGCADARFAVQQLVLAMGYVSWDALDYAFNGFVFVLLLLHKCNSVSSMSTYCALNFETRTCGSPRSLLAPSERHICWVEPSIHTVVP